MRLHSHLGWLNLSCRSIGEISFRVLGGSRVEVSPVACLGAILPELSNFYCRPGRAGGTPLVIRSLTLCAPKTRSARMVLPSAGVSVSRVRPCSGYEGATTAQGESETFFGGESLTPSNVIRTLPASTNLLPSGSESGPIC